MTTLAVIPLRSLFRVNGALQPRAPERRYYEYHFEAGFMLEVQRLGECCGCGQCCQHTIRLTNLLDPERPAFLDGTDWNPATNGKGMWNVVEDGQGWQYATQVDITDHGGLWPKHLEPRTCPAFDLARRNCTIHHTGKPAICQEWPSGENEARLSPECTYYFRPLAAWHLNPDGTAGAAISLEGII